MRWWHVLRVLLSHLKGRCISKHNLRSIPTFPINRWNKILLEFLWFSVLLSRNFIFHPFLHWQYLPICILLQPTIDIMGGQSIPILFWDVSLALIKDVRNTLRARWQLFLARGCHSWGVHYLGTCTTESLRVPQWVLHPTLRLGTFNVICCQTVWGLVSWVSKARFVHVRTSSEHIVFWIFKFLFILRKSIIGLNM